MAALDDFERLQDEIAACRRCRTHPTLGPVIEAGIAGGDVFTPLRNPRPYPPGSRVEDVAYLVVGMEPSSSAENQMEAEARVVAGRRNGCPILFQYSLERWLLRPGEAWAFTDAGKCAMHMGDMTDKTRSERWLTCLAWLGREISLFTPNAIIAVGDKCFKFLKKRRSPNWPPLYSVMHFSPSVREEQRTRYLMDDYAGHLARRPPSDEVERWAKERLASLGTAEPSFNVTPSDWDLLAEYHRRFPQIKEHLSPAGE